jgi:flagellar hook-associated protein 3 FlgL
MRITSMMMQRGILSDIGSLSSQLALTQSKAASGKQITRPSDDPFGAAKAMALRSSLSAGSAYQSSIDDATGWQDATETSLGSITDYIHRASDLVVQGASDTSDATSRNAIASEIDQIIQGVKETANATYGTTHIFSGTATGTAPYAQGDDDTYKGNQAGLDPAVPGVLREIGPGVTMSINTVGQEILGDGTPTPPATGDGKLLDTLRAISAHLKANDGASLRGGDITALQTNLNTVLDVRARNGAQTNRLTAASSRLDDITLSVTKQLSDTEDADIAKTMIDFNSQSAAYTAALRAGASIVQTSLMDFLH